MFAKVAPRRGPPKQYVELLETRLRMVEKALSLLEKSNQDQTTASLDEEPQASWDQPRYGMLASHPCQKKKKISKNACKKGRIVFLVSTLLFFDHAQIIFIVI